MRIGSSTDKKDSGKIHVDFAQARDDLYEWECKQRLLAREERHRRKIQEDRMRPPSPPPIVHYSEHEAALLAEKLKGKDSAQSSHTPKKDLTEARDPIEVKVVLFRSCRLVPVRVKEDERRQ